MPTPAQLAAVKITKAAVGKPATIQEWLELGRDLIPEDSREELIRKIGDMIAAAQQIEEMKGKIIEAIVKSAATPEKKEMITQGLEQFWKDARPLQKSVLKTMPEIACKALSLANNPGHVAGLVGVWTSMPPGAREAYLVIKVTDKNIEALFKALNASYSRILMLKSKK